MLIDKKGKCIQKQNETNKILQVEVMSEREGSPFTILCL